MSNRTTWFFHRNALGLYLLVAFSVTSTGCKDGPETRPAGDDSTANGSSLGGDDTPDGNNSNDPNPNPNDDGDGGNDDTSNDSPSGSGDPDDGASNGGAELCGCDGGGSCIEGTNASACARLRPTCTGRLLVETCTTDAVASCDFGESILYYAWQRIDDWLETAEAACTSPGSTFSVAAIPTGEGSGCSCQRSPSLCAQAYGTACDSLTCDDPAGVQADSCGDIDRVPGRCVARDGQFELVFYAPAASSESAETSCLSASSTELYWFPDGI